MEVTNMYAVALSISHAALSIEFWIIQAKSSNANFRGFIFSSSCQLINPLQTIHLFLWEQNLLKLLPENREQNSLHTVGKNLGLQTTEHEPPDSRFLYHILHNLRIRQIFWMRLLVNLHDTDRVRASITDSRRAETHKSPTAEFAELSVLLGNLGPQEIVCCEPGWRREQTNVCERLMFGAGICVLSLSVNWTYQG